MCKSPLHDLLVALPKCEHHMHLEGSLSPELLFELAAKNNITLPKDDPAFASVDALYERYKHFTSLDDFLHYYYIGFTVLVTPSDFESLAYAYLARAASPAHNVRHAELFFDPQPHLARGIPLTAIIPSFQRAQERAQTAFGITSLLIPCLLRHLPAADAAAAFKALGDGGFYSATRSGPNMALEDPPLVGLGLCGSELGKPPAAWADVFRLASAWDIRRTVHAGEEGPASFVAAALDDLHAERIDHGIKAAQDPEVVARLVQKGVMLTVCPLSNVSLKGVGTMAELPIRVFLDAGVRFSINSDDPAYFGGYIQENYCAVEEAFGLSEKEWEGIVKAGVQGSWCGDGRKSEILEELEKVLKDWQAKGEGAKA